MKETAGRFNIDSPTNKERLCINGYKLFNETHSIYGGTSIFTHVVIADDTPIKGMLLPQSLEVGEVYELSSDHFIGSGLYKCVAIYRLPLRLNGMEHWIITFGINK